MHKAAGSLEAASDVVVGWLVGTDLQANKGTYKKQYICSDTCLTTCPLGCCGGIAYNSMQGTRILDRLFKLSGPDAPFLLSLSAPLKALRNMVVFLHRHYCAISEEPCLKATIAFWSI